MNEPARLRDEGPEEVRAMLRAGSATVPMTRQERERTGARIGRYAAVAAVMGGIAWLPGAAFGAGVGVAAVAVAWGVPALFAPAPPPSTAPAPVAAVATSGLPRTAAQPAPRPEPTPTAPPPAPAAPHASAVPATATPSPHASADAPALDPLAEEAALLERARAALGASPAEALALTETHASRFPAGKLGMEREIVAVDALRRLGRRDEARARGEALLTQAKGSLYESRVRQLLDGVR